MNEIITTEQMRAIDAASAISGIATRTLMENAGRAVADAVEARFTPRQTSVLCGPGNNGGDGWVAARLLMERGWPIVVQTLKPAVQLWGDAFDAAAAFKGEVHLSSEMSPPAELYIDALFGAGLSRPLEGEAARIVESLSGQSARMVAIDVPSGVEGDSGRALGPHLSAALTVTFVRKKPAHLLYPGKAACGEIVLADIGAPEDIVAAQHVTLWENAPLLWSARFPWPSPQAHKHARGHVMVASGGLARTGAARLAARAALRAGAGLVTVLSPQDALTENAAHLTAIMLREAGDAEALAYAAQDASCLVIGPAFGTSPAHREKLKAVLAPRNRAPIVLDADALTLLGPLKSGALHPRDVLTPHIGEFKRVFPDLADAPSKIEAARAASARCGAIVLLKGPDTVIAAPDGRAIINSNGTPFLATAGAGDVLAGIIAALIAQGMDSFDAASAGAWLHAASAESIGPGLISEDLPEALPRVLNMLAPEHLRAR